MNKQQYEWIRQSRQIVFAQCKALSNEQLAHEHGFAINTIKDTLIHITKAYRNWIGSYLLGNKIVGDYPADVVEAMTFDDIEKLYALVDDYVWQAIEKYERSMDVLMATTSDFKRDGETTKTPNHLLFHVFTHECHHRGQVTAMLHLLGVKPDNVNIVFLQSESV